VELLKVMDDRAVACHSAVKSLELKAATVTSQPVLLLGCFPELRIPNRCHSRSPAPFWEALFAIMRGVAIIRDPQRFLSPKRPGLSGCVSDNLESFETEWHEILLTNLTGGQNRSVSKAESLDFMAYIRAGDWTIEDVVFSVKSPA
jgi:hypothetical protein